MQSYVLLSMSIFFIVLESWSNDEDSCTSAQRQIYQAFNVAIKEKKQKQYAFALNLLDDRFHYQTDKLAVW